MLYTKKVYRLQGGFKQVILFSVLTLSLFEIVVKELVPLNCFKVICLGKTCDMGSNGEKFQS
jgi:hypothetical protein